MFEEMKFFFNVFYRERDIVMIELEEINGKLSEVLVVKVLLELDFYDVNEKLEVVIVE